MRKFLLLVLLIGSALPGRALEPITVDQLQQLLAAAKDKPDAKLAQQLSRLELTDRLSTSRLSQWQAGLPGPESRRSLVMLADASAFLDLPTAEIPDTTAPNLTAQHDLISLTFHNVAKTIREFVVDQNSGRMGSVTIPTAVLHANL